MTERDLSHIKLALFDVDGIMTNGEIFLNSDGKWRRFFNIRDGYGMLLLQGAGVKTGIITASNAEDVRTRFEFLKVDYFYDNQKEKLTSFLEILAKEGVDAGDVAYMGDDLPDIHVLKQVGFAATVPKAVPEVREICHYITSNEGGMGAVREVCDLIRRGRPQQGE